MVVNVQRHNDLAVINIDTPPVNALVQKLRAGLMEALDGLRGESGLKAIVLAGTARAFSGGADITEFGKPPTERNLRVVIAAIGDMSIPVVAAIQGNVPDRGVDALGGCGRRPSWGCRRSSWGSCRARAARSACRGSWAWRRHSA